MTVRVFTNRSRTETYQRCHRARFLEYHQDQVGVVGTKKALPLIVGGAVHEGYAIVLRKMIDPRAVEDFLAGIAIGTLEDEAVKAGLDFLKEWSGKLELDLSEKEKLQGDIKTLEAQLLESLGTTEEEQVEQIAKMRAKAVDQFDQFLFEEQQALVEAMIRAWCRRNLRKLLEQFAVLEVERKGEWLLSQWAGEHKYIGTGEEFPHDTKIERNLWELWFMSRPDAILLERESKQLYIQSFKSGASWDIRKAKDAERDMQGLSEGVEVEKRLGEVWEFLHKHRGHVLSGPEELKNHAVFVYGPEEKASHRLQHYLAELSAPPRIFAIRYEYILKGDRKVDKDLTAELGLEVRSQQSLLVRGYLNPGMTAEDSQWNWSWDYLKEGGETSKLYWKSWRGTQVWKHMPIKRWIDMLDSAVMATGEEGRDLGYSSPAQATGFTQKHPFDAVFVPPIIVYRNDDDLRDWIEQIEAQEVLVAQNVSLVNAATDPAERRHLLNVHFQQTRKACEYPSTCQFVRICFGGDEIRKNPLGSGLYQLRKANHPQENQK